MGHTCAHQDAKLKFIGKTNLSACEAACAAEPGCVTFDLQIQPTPGWCALYGVLAVPLVNAKYACVCKGPCPSAPPPPHPGPRPPPGPPGPRPPAPPVPPLPPTGPPRGVMDAYYYGWATYWNLLLDAGRPPYVPAPKVLL